MDLSPISPTSHYINVSSSNTYQNDASYAPSMAFDGDNDTRWATDDGVKQCWISAGLPEAKSITGVEIREAYPGRIQKFEFQYKATDTSDWVTLVTGAQIGADYKTTFPAVVANSIRLNILDATDGPTISEITLISSK